MSNVLGFQLSNTTYFIHSSDATQEVARFGSSNDTSHIRLYSASLSNAGYTLETIQHPDYCDFSLAGHDLPTPSLYIQGYSGRVGIKTDNPTYDLTVFGNLFVSGQLIQQGTSVQLSSETVYSTTIYADYIYSCNQYGNIDLTSNSILNLKKLQILDTATVGNSVSVGTAPPLAPLHVKGAILQVMDNMQKYQILTGQTPVPGGSPGTLRKFGFILAWSAATTPDPSIAALFPASSSQIFDVTGSTYMTGRGIRQNHRFSALVDPTDNASASPQALPGLDQITDQNSFVSPNFGKSTLKITRYSPTSVQIYIEWHSPDVPTGYTANMRLEIFAPVSLGTLSAVPFLT
jgi:hypothetical protein